MQRASDGLLRSADAVSTLRSGVALGIQTCICYGDKSSGRVVTPGVIVLEAPSGAVLAKRAGCLCGRLSSVRRVASAGQSENYFVKMWFFSFFFLRKEIAQLGLGRCGS